MWSITTLPVIMALSVLPGQQTETPAPTAGEEAQSVQQEGTVTCPITGEKIPACCCPVEEEKE